MPEPATSSTSAGSSFRVLIADDCKNAAEILAMFFQMEGMETAVALDGVQAVALAKTFNPDLIFLDLQMPKMDGYEAARLIRQASDQTVIIALSGWDGTDERRRATEAGFDSHLVKPIRPDDLRAIVTQYLNDKPQKN